MNIEFEATVRDLSHKGLGVVDHPDGRVFFVRGVWPGDRGSFLVPEGAASYAEATLLTLLAPSAERVDVPCPHRGSTPGKCGGCPWMIANYSSQIHYKLKRLTHNLEKRGLSLRGMNLRPVLTSEEITGYRNRVQLKTDGLAIGYVSEGSSVLAPVEECLILNPRLRELFQELRATLPRDDFRPSEGFHWNFIDLDDEMTLEDLRLNRRRPFRQGNSQQNDVMKSWLRRKLEAIPRHHPVIDLFCGSGNFTEVFSEMGFENILAVEVQGVALKELERRALPGVRILALDVDERGAWARMARLQPHARLLLTDPPREGMRKRRGLFKYLDNLENILYVSCEPDTFSRDARDISRCFGFVDLTPLDLFPHTPHLEILAHFHRPRPV